ncbi:MAG: hypothetical protein WCV89_00005, partial [Candidatus Paceibacterota bacterium]
YKLNLLIAHQYIEQMEEEVRDAVFGNVGTTVVFRVGPFDAEVLETIFMPKFTKEDVVALDKRQVYLSLMIDGVGSAPFSAVTIPPIEPPPVSYRERVIASSREQFTAERAGVENVIVEELAASAASPAPFDARMKKKPAPLERPPTPPLRQAASPMPPREERPLPPVSQGIAPRPFVKREEAPRPPERRMDPPREQKREVARPPVVTKSAEELKAILRTMTTKTGMEKEQKQTENKQSLKGALAEVLQKSQQPRRPQGPEPRPIAPEEMQKPAAAEPPRAAPTSEVGTPTASVGKEKKPFEVSEEALRKVLKGES